MKRISLIIIVLIGITFLNACGNKEVPAENKAQDNNIIGAGITADEPSDGPSVDTAADLGVSTGTAKKPKLPKLPSGAQADTTVNENKVEAEVKSILSDIANEENQDTGIEEETETTK